jgi:uncharacterized protein
MYLSVRTFLERIRPKTGEQSDLDWLERGGEAHTKREYLKALKAWKMASAEGDVESQYRIGLLYARGEGLVRSIPDAVSWFRQAADAGHIEAQYQLGLIYLNGAIHGPVTADAWFQAASQHNNEVAQENLKVLFPNGIAVEKDLTEAMRWIWAAATAGKADAQAVLGEMYRRGLGCVQDYAEAARWLWLAAEQGVASAQFAMGDIYYQALGVAADHRVASGWYERAANNGDARAQVALASMCLVGEGRLVDKEGAGRLFVQAAEQGEARGLYQAALMHLKGEGLPENIDRAETYLRKAAKQSYLPAIIKLAEFYSHGRSVEPDLREAATWYIRAADLGDVQSQFLIGQLYATGTGVPVNVRESARWFLRAAEQGHATATHNIAAYYATGAGVERDLEQAINWYRKAAEEGITASLVQLGKLYFAGEGVPRDLQKAGFWFRKAAESGDPEAKTALAILHLQDEEGLRDPSRAEELLKQAAEGGDPAAAMQLGHLYSGKYAVEKKSGDAILWYTKAAEGDAIEAQHTLGMLYLNGRGVAKNLSAAASWIEKAAQGGHAPSQFQLAVLYCTAQGVLQDLAKAVTWYEQAAERGHALAQYNLAVMLSKGQGCDADKTLAASWFEKAAQQGVAQAQRALADLRPAADRNAQDNNLAANSLSQKRPITAPHSTTPYGADQASEQTSPRSNQSNSAEPPPRHPPDKGSTEPSANGVPRQNGPLRPAEALSSSADRPPLVKGASAPPVSKIDHDRGQRHQQPSPEERASGDVHSSDLSRSHAQTNNAAARPVVDRDRPKLSWRGDQHHSEPTATVVRSIPNQPRAEQCNAERHPDEPAAYPRPDHPLEVSENSRPKRPVEGKTNFDRRESLTAFKRDSASVNAARAISVSGRNLELKTSAGPTVAHAAVKDSEPAKRDSVSLDRSPVIESMEHHIKENSRNGSSPLMENPLGSKPGADARGHETIFPRKRGASASTDQAPQGQSVHPATIDSSVSGGVGGTTPVDAAERYLTESLTSLSGSARGSPDSRETQRPYAKRPLPTSVDIFSVDGVDANRSSPAPPSNVRRRMSDLEACSSHDEESRSKLDSRPEDHDAFARAMSDLRRHLEAFENDDLKAPSSLTVGRVRAGTADDRRDAPGLHNRQNPTMSAHTDDAATRDDTAFRKLSRAMAELGVEFGKRDVSKEPTSNDQTIAPEGFPREAITPEPDPTAPETAKLSNNRQSQLPSIEAIDGSTPPTATTAIRRSNAAINQQQGPLRAEDRSRPNTDQVKTLRGPATDFEAFGGAEAPTLIEQAVREEKIVPVLLQNTNKVPTGSKAVGKPLTIESESKSITEMRKPYVDVSPSVSRPTPHISSHRSPDRSIAGQAVDRFLAELGRQLDDIELPPRRSPQR